MKQIIFLSCLVFLSCTLSTAHASTAGQVTYDASGKPVPVNDPAIAGVSPTPVYLLADIPDSIKKLPKKIDVDLSAQTLSYYYGDHLVGTIKISSGIARLPTPRGTFQVLEKIPVKNYAGRNPNGTRYYLPDTKWNLKFSSLGYYIHGAYWHNNFGHPMSHGCVNVSYTDMPQLYEFASVGTRITIHK